MDISQKEIISCLELCELKISEAQRYLHLLNAQTSCNFNVIKLFYIDENKVSDILATLFDPVSTHGQGRYFLDKFLEYFAIPMEIKNDYTVNREKGKIDILISDGKSAIIFENKIFHAPDQDEQIDRYIDYVVTKCGVSNVSVIYLKDGALPPETSFSRHRKEFLAMSRMYGIPVSSKGEKDLASYLRYARSDINFKLQHFLGDLISYVSEEIEMDNLKNDVIAWMKEDAKRALAVQTASRYFDELKTQLIKEFVNTLLNSAKNVFQKKDNKLIVDAEPGFGASKLKGLYVRKSTWEDRYDVRIHQDDANLKDVYLTIRKHNSSENAQDEAEIVKLLKLDSGDPLHVGYRYMTQQVKIHTNIADVMEPRRDQIINEWILDLVAFYDETSSKVDELVKG